MNNTKAKKQIINAFIEELRQRWINIKKLSETFPGEGLVLAYCFTEAMGYYRFGFGENASKLSSAEQFVKILHDYQSSKVFMIIPYLFVKEIPLENGKRPFGQSIKEDVLNWLKTALPKDKDLHIATIWEQIPRNIYQAMNKRLQMNYGYLYQLTWAGYYYHMIRTAGIHKGNFPRTNVEDELKEVIKANNEILNRLGKECLDEVKFPHELDQPVSLYDVVY